jgi:hypothetical protein
MTGLGIALWSVARVILTLITHGIPLLFRLVLALPAFFRTHRVMRGQQQAVNRREAERVDRIRNPGKYVLKD